MNDLIRGKTHTKSPGSGDLPAANRPYAPYGFYCHSSVSRLAYTGQLRDAVSGCYNLGNGYRAYSPSLMRFKAADSLSPFDKGGLNAYAYCGGDPVNRTDTNGHFFNAAGVALRIMGMFSNTLTIAYNFLGPAPVNRIGVNATRLSTVGSVLSLGSSAALAAGVPSAVFGANVGTAVSLLATSVRAVNAAIGPGSKPWSQIKENWRLMTAGVPETPPAPDTVLEMVTTTRSGLMLDVQPVRYDVNGALYRRKAQSSSPGTAVTQRARSLSPNLIRKS